MQYDRRTVLRSAATGLVGTGAGCLDGVGSESEQANAPASAAGTGTPAGTWTTTAGNSTGTETAGTTEPSPTTEGSTPATTSEPTCEDGLRRLRIDLPADYELAYYQGFDFELTADPEPPGTVAVGDELAFELWNTADEPQTTGLKAKYAIERRIEDGWRHVLQVPAGYTPSQERVTHQPGEGFTWRFPVNREGFSVDPYTICAPLQSGEYHFTYWGFPEAMRGLTIAFEIE